MDVFERLYIHLQHGINNVKPWLCVTTRNRAYDYLRLKNKMSNIDSAMSNCTLDTNVDRVFISDLLHQLYTHNKKWYDIVVMHYILGMSNQDISSELGCSRLAVKNILYRAKSYLKNQYPELTLLICFLFATTMIERNL
jgi:RNA polymerase sigma factor (sigma-70 family)